MANGETPKPGYKTTEFWVTVAIQLVGLAGIFGYITPEQQNVLTDAAIQQGSIVSMVAAAFGYSLSRGIAKRKQ